MKVTIKYENIKADTMKEANRIAEDMAMADIDYHNSDGDVFCVRLRKRGITMACILGVEQSCTECRMCRGRTFGKNNETTGNEMVCVQQSAWDQEWNRDVSGQISMDKYLQSLK